MIGKILIVGDIHYSQYSSIIRKRGTEYSKRLENCINSINWVEQIAEENSCDRIIYLGDFFDRAELNSEEITALKEIYWSNIPHQLIVGNHELGSANGDYNTAQVLGLLPNFEIINKPKLENGFGYRLLYLPYIFESDRKNIGEYLSELIGLSWETQELKNTYIFSHNDIKGINYGAFESKEGFDIRDIENNCSIYFNGHIHNGAKIGNKIINIGNLTGQNFSEDAAKYQHKIYLLEVNPNNTVPDFKIQEFINPYAYNFYKFNVNSFENITNIIDTIKQHSILSIKCIESLVAELKQRLDRCSKIEEYKVITIIENKEENQEDIKILLSKDHLNQFKEYILDHLGNSDIVQKELQEILSYDN